MPGGTASRTWGHTPNVPGGTTSRTWRHKPQVVRQVVPVVIYPRWYGKSYLGSYTPGGTASRTWDHTPQLVREVAPEGTGGEDGYKDVSFKWSVSLKMFICGVF